MPCARNDSELNAPSVYSLKSMHRELRTFFRDFGVGGQKGTHGHLASLGEQGGALLLPELVCDAGTVEAKRPSPTSSRGAARSRQQRQGGALRLPELICGAGTVEAKRPSPTRIRGAAKSRQRRRSGALQLPELVCGAGTVLPCRPRRRNRSAAAP